MTSSFHSLLSYAERHADRHLADLFELEPDRVDRLSQSVGPLYFDFAKQPIDAEALDLFTQLATDSELDRWRDALFAGEILNPSENRPALHTALRAADPPRQSAQGDAVAERVEHERQACYDFARGVREGKIHSPSGAPYRHLIHIGIGGSYLGPKMLVEALDKEAAEAIQVHFVANIDGHALAPILAACDPEQTLIVGVSKTFTTAETLHNARSALQWLRDGGVAEPLQQMVAVTANPSAARDFGVADERIFTFGDWVGGRYSLWSAVSLSAMIALGPDVFDDFLAGARLMDEHFCSEPLATNAPMLAGCLDFYFSSIRSLKTRAVFPYDARLATLPNYLQQLEMESNGKQIDRRGEPLAWSTAPITWGGVGTDAQHAVFQLLHQGSHLVPTEFIAALRPDHDLAGHHRSLLANCFAQSSALMLGRGEDFPGNKPSTTILLEGLDATALGALIAFYEHRTFVAGTLWQLNVFDQPGVELGKSMAKELEGDLGGGQAASRDASTAKLLKMLKEIDR